MKLKKHIKDLRKVLWALFCVVFVGGIAGLVLFAIKNKDSWQNGVDGWIVVTVVYIFAFTILGLVLCAIALCMTNDQLICLEGKENDVEAVGESD